MNKLIAHISYSASKVQEKKMNCQFLLQLQPPTHNKSCSNNFLLKIEKCANEFYSQLNLFTCSHFTSIRCDDPKSTKLLRHRLTASRHNTRSFFFFALVSLLFFAAADAHYYSALPDVELDIFEWVTLYLSMTSRRRIHFWLVSSCTFRVKINFMNKIGCFSFSTRTTCRNQSWPYQLSSASSKIVLCEKEKSSKIDTNN